MIHLQKITLIPAKQPPNGPKTGDGQSVPLFGIASQSDYKWQYNALVSRLQNPELYSAQEDVPATIEELARWLINKAGGSAEGVLANVLYC